MRKAILLALALLAAPPLARAGTVAMRVQDVPSSTRALASATVPALPHFNLLAVHWSGSGAVRFRTHRVRGGWSAWQTADADAAPDGGTGGRHDGGLVWVGTCDRMQFRTTGEASRLQAYELWSRVLPTPPGRGARRLSAAEAPAIVSRAEWGAQEDIVHSPPLYAPRIRLAIVHHTAGTNEYTPAQAAAIVRGIEVYHVQGNGWNDIGYNFLVDRFGTVYEGRAGGIDRNVVGAHAEGFNAGSVGVALIGDFQRAVPPPAQQAALVKLLAWRLDLAHVDPLSTVVVTSGGNAKYPAGAVVTLRAVSGHRDTGPSECPGRAAYLLLPSIARRAAATGLPKIYAPTVSGVLGGDVRFQARLSSPSRWSVTVADELGVTVAHGSGRGALVDWTWQAPPPAGSGYIWTISAPSALDATGTIGSAVASPPATGPQPATLQAVSVVPSLLAPAADGSGATADLAFTLGVPSTVTAAVLDSSGTVVQSVLDGKALQAGPQHVAVSIAGLPDGRYTLSVSAVLRAGGKASARTVPLVVDRSVTGLRLSAPTLSPDGDGSGDTVTIGFTLAASLPVRIEVRQGGVSLATLFQGVLPAGPFGLTWDGTSGGTALPGGAYTVTVTVVDALGSVAYATPFTIAVAGPAPPQGFGP